MPRFKSWEDNTDPKDLSVLDTKLSAFMVCSVPSTFWSLGHVLDCHALSIRGVVNSAAEYGPQGYS
jgi:hypothetical protein